MGSFLEGKEMGGKGMLSFLFLCHPFPCLFSFSQSGELDSGAVEINPLHRLDAEVVEQALQMTVMLPDFSRDACDDKTVPLRMGLNQVRAQKVDHFTHRNS